jgi:hypothetical protein
VICAAQSDDITSSSDYITRLNYGFAAVKIQTGCVTHRVWTHMYHFTLPNVSRLMAPPPMNDTNFEVCSGICRRLATVKKSLNTLTNSTDHVIRSALTRIKNLIPDIRAISQNSRGNRQQRGFANFVGTLSKYLFGTAEDSDVDKLKAEIELLKGVMNEVATDSVRSRNA